MALISYEISMDPPNPEVQISINLESNQQTSVPENLLIKVEKLGDLSLSVKPSTGTIVGGAIAGTVLGGFVGTGLSVGAIYGAAELIKSEMESAIKSNLTGKELARESLAGQLGYSFTVEGVVLKVTAKTANLSTYNGMLMVDGTVDVS